MAALWSPLEASSRRRISKGTAGGRQQTRVVGDVIFFQAMMLSHGREIPLNPMKKCGPMFHLNFRKILCILTPNIWEENPTRSFFRW